jgi:adenylate cyclase
MSEGVVLVLALLMPLSFKVYVNLSLFFAVPVGFSVLLLQWVQKAVRFRSFFATAVTQAVLYFLDLALCIVLVFVSLKLSGDFNKEASFHSLDAWFAHNYGFFLLFCAAFLFLVFVVTAVTELSRKIGPRVMRNWLLGYYHNPRKEDRVVMFLDLKGSTTLGEQLGDEKFSAFVRDFFGDMSEPLEQTKGEVSHYIGDEAVITWNPVSGANEAKAIEFVYLFEQVLAEKADRYAKHYGVVPAFKVGLHLGSVVVTEVGKTKSEFVLHGDTLNTAARLQGLCNEKGCRLILSDSIAGRLPHRSWFRVSPLGRVQLKGKLGETAVHRADWDILPG